MSIELSKDKYFIGIWFVGHNEVLPVKERMDWLGAIWREPNGEWIERWRFRYHTGGEDPMAKGDEKSWHGYVIGPEVPEDQVEETMHVLASLVSAKNGAPVHYIEVRGDGLKAAELLAEQPWTHSTTIKKDEK